ncbi:MAG: hypothetical protein ACE5J7_01970 [Candidatus Aenigmatarchaeota archaeon]
MVMEDVSAAWHSYKRNLKSLLGGIFLIYVVIYGSVLVGFVPMFSYLYSYSAYAATCLGPTAICAAPPVMGLFPPVFMGIMLVVALLLAYVLVGGFIKMCEEALKRRTRVKTMIETSKKKWKPFIGVGLLVFAITMLVFGIFLAPLVLGIVLQSPGLFMFGMIFMYVGYIAIFIVALLLIFSFQAVALDNYRVVEAVKRSYHLSKSNFLSVLALMILLGIMMFAVALVPTIILALILSLLLSLQPLLSFYFAFIIGIIFAVPIQYLGFTSFYLRNRRKVRKPIKRKK